MATQTTLAAISVFNWGTGVYRINRGPLPVDCLGCSYQASIPLTTELDLPDKNQNLTWHNVQRWFIKQEKKGIVFEPNPWEDWMD